VTEPKEDESRRLIMVAVRAKMASAVVSFRPTQRLPDCYSKRVENAEQVSERVNQRSI
jgi:hypothetical protein